MYIASITRNISGIRRLLLRACCLQCSACTLWLVGRVILTFCLVTVGTLRRTDVVFVRGFTLFVCALPLPV